MRTLLRGHVLVVLSFFAVFFVTSAFGQEKMSMDDYRAQLQEAQDREARAKADLQKCEEDKSNLQGEITSVDGQIKAKWDEIYALVGTDAAGVDAYRNSLNAIEAEVDGLAALSPEDLFKRRAELDDIEARLNQMKESKVYALTEMQNKVASIEGKITNLRNRMPKAMYDEYTVMRGDYLWKISGKGDIYADPFQWIRIYSYNIEQIKNPDLIFPDQVFKIQRGVGPDEYLVEKGDFLHKIAGKADVLGDPTKWTQLYEANKAVVGDDPSLIYPYQVLRVPR